MYSFGNLWGGGLKVVFDGYVYYIYDVGVNDNSGQVWMGRIVVFEIFFDGMNFDVMYQVGFNSGVSMVFDDVFFYNFLEFVSVLSWLVELVIEGDVFFCIGEMVLLMVIINLLGQIVESYIWSLDGVVFFIIVIVQLDIDQGGFYQVMVELVGGCIIVLDILLVEIVVLV